MTLGNPIAALRADPKKLDWTIALAFFFGTVVLLLITSQQVGFTRDEGYYFKAGQEYFGWFKDVWASLWSGHFTHPFQKAVIDKNWAYNHEHPVLVKSLFALSWGLLHEWLGIFQKSSDALRFPAFCFGGLTVSLIFLLGKDLISRRAGLLAAFMWLSMPRVFWQMQLACFDIPVCAAHLWLIAAYLKGRRSIKGALVVGVAFGLAASVKHNILVTPAFLVLHWMLTEASGGGAARRGLRLPPVPLAFFSMAIIGPIVFILHWPYLWPDILARIGWYIGFHLHHEHYPILYFGDLLTHPPFPMLFPFVMSAVTVPVPVLAAMLSGTGLASVVGAKFLWRRFFPAGAEHALTRVPLGDPASEPTGSVALLLLLNAAFPFALIALPSTPIFGGTKHWMNALPFLCLLGAWAIEEGLARVAIAGPAFLKRAGRQRLFVVVAALVVLPGILLTARVHPYGLASYNALAGFARGAANIGFQRTFWGYEIRKALPEINARAKKNARMVFGDTNYDDFKAYKRDGLIRKDIRWSNGVKGTDVASVQPQGEFKKQWLSVQKTWNVAGPDRVIAIEGVPLLTVNFNE